MRHTSRLAALLLFLLPSIALAQQAPAPFVVTKVVTLGGEGGWDYLQLSPDGRTLYIPRAPAADVVDTRTDRIVATIPGFVRPHGTALAPGLHRGFISDGDRNGSAGVTIFDTRTHRTLGKIKTPPDSDGILFDPASGHVFVVSGDDNSVTCFPADIDPAAGKPDPAIPLGGAPESLVSDNAGRIFIDLKSKDQVVVLDAKTHAILHRFPTAPGGEPTGLAIDPVAHRLFVGCRNPARLVVMSADDGKVLADFPIGQHVDAGAFDAPYAFASCGDGTLGVVRQIDPNHYALAATLKTAPGARTMTVDPLTHTAYLATADFEPASARVSRRRPRYISGTFKLIVVSRR